MAANGVEGVQELYDTHWSTNWSDLPTDIESEVEAAFEHIQRAHDMIGERGLRDGGD